MNDTILQQQCLHIQELTWVDINNLQAVSTMLDGIEQDTIGYVCWHKLWRVPLVRFAMAYTNNALLLKYYVSEQEHRAIYTQNNDPVFKDSCVEFFVAIDAGGSYYNFEFNSLGTCLASYGSSRHNRIKLNNACIDTVQRSVTWKTNQPKVPLYQWELTVVIPLSVFRYNDLSAFEPATFKANFYKCGDGLTEPHYLAWNPVTSHTPDYHQPAYFGLINLM